jgi:hypothetical protein
MTDDERPPVVENWIRTNDGVALSIETKTIDGRWIQSVDWCQLEKFR